MKSERSFLNVYADFGINELHCSLIIIYSTCHPRNILVQYRAGIDFFLDYDFRGGGAKTCWGIEGVPVYK